MTSANTNALTAFWLGLPEELKSKLRLGFTGKQHLLDIAGWCLRSGSTELLPLAVDSLQTAFGEHPLDGEMAREFLAIEPIKGILPRPTLEALTALADHWKKPENTSYFERLLQQRDYDKTKHYLEQSIAKEPDNLFWKQQVLTFGLIENDVEWVESMIQAPTSEHLLPVINCISAFIHNLRGKHQEAARLYQAIETIFGVGFSSRCAGLSILRSGDPAAANLYLLKGVSRTPWNINLIQRVHDLLSGRDTETRIMAGSTAVVLYTWNKDVEIDATLRTLFESDLSGASVFVLNNGSTDDTCTVLESWATRFKNLLGDDRFEVITLPVNIGAPAARNWLMHLPAVKEHDFICYLDDDVELPADWLLRLGAAVHHYPDAGVWGCKVVDHVNNALIQSADSHLMVDPNAPSLDLSNAAPNPFKLSDLHIQGMDTGLLDMLRPCASVTGCCHVFRTETLLESGDFAIHLSPTQYDDMEHDLRLCKAGKFAVYQGHLSIQHKKRSGAASRTSMKEEGNALGNKYKMQTMHTHEELLAAQEQEQILLELDIIKKIKVIEQA